MDQSGVRTFCQLPTHVADPLERIAFIDDAMAEAKGDFDLLPAEAMLELVEMAPPALAEEPRVWAAFRITDRIHSDAQCGDLHRTRPPPTALSARRQDVALHPGEHDHRRCRAEHHRAELLDTLDFGLVADWQLVPDLWSLCDLCVDEVEVLAAAVGL